MEDRSRTGVVHYNYTMGGSLLANCQILSQANGSTPGIAIEGFNGVDAIFARPDFDVIFCTFLVNDAGATTDINVFYTLIDRAVAKALENRIEIVYLVEMGGHFSQPTDPSYNRFNAYRDYLLQVGEQNNHVTVIGSHGLTMMSDLTAYQARYYTGDFIHPTAEGHQVAQVAMAQALGIDPPIHNNTGPMGFDRYTTVRLPTSPASFVASDGRRRRYKKRTLARGPVLPLHLRDVPTRSVLPRRHGPERVNVDLRGCDCG